jgi:SPRY domain
VKLTDPDTGASLWDKLRKLIALPTDRADGAVDTKVKPSATKTTRIKKRSPQKRDWEKTVEFLMNEFSDSIEEAITDDWLNDRFQELKSKTFNEDYWVKAEQIALDTIEATATPSEWTGQRNYSYPDENNVPTKTAYGTGSISAGDPSYNGATVDGVYSDSSLKWWRIVYRLATTMTKQSPRPLYIHVTGTLRNQYDGRPHRASLSLLIGREICLAGAAPESSLEAPLQDVISAWYRYQLPENAEGPHTSDGPIDLMYPVSVPEHIQDGVDCDTVVITICPTPMKGYRYNNNELVATALMNLQVDLWEVIKKEFATWNPDDKTAGVTLSGGNLVAEDLINGMVRATVAKDTGKWYWEYEITFAGFSAADALIFGTATETEMLCASCVGIYGHGIGNYNDDGTILTYKQHGGGTTNYGSEFASGDVIGIALDLDTGTIEFFINGVSQGIAFTGITGTFCPAVCAYSILGSGVTCSVTANFGAGGPDAFAHPVPDGFNPGVY